MNTKNYNKRVVQLGIIGAVCILLFFALQNIDLVVKAFSWLTDLFLPLIVGFGLALVIDMPMQFFEKRLLKKCRKPWMKKLCSPVAFIISIVLIVAVVVWVIYLVIPQLSEGIRVIFNSTSELKVIIAEADGRLLKKLPFGDMLMRIDRERLIDSILELFGNQSGSFIDTAVDTIGAVINILVDGFLAIILAIYIIFGKDKLRKQTTRFVRAWMPEKGAGWLMHAAVVTNNIFRNFIAGQTIEAIILGVLCGVGMAILNLPYAAAIGALVGVTALIPVIGCFAGIIIGVFMIVVVDPMKAVIFLIYLLILHQVEENVIYPRVMGNKVSLPSLWVMAAVVIGGRLAGATGMLLGVPITATVYTLVKEATLKKEAEKQLHENTEQIFE